MAEGVLFDIIKDLLESLGKSAFQEVSSWCGAKADLQKLDESLKWIKARIIDAERRHEEESSEAIKEWLRRLRAVLYRADDLFDDVFTDQRRKQRLKGKMAKKVRMLFSSSNPILFNRQVAREIKSIREELDAIKSDMDGLNLRICDHRADSQLQMARLMSNRKTTSIDQPHEFFGRDDDKNKIINILMRNEENVSVIPIVGFGGIGKTTLAQLVFNDERVKNHFELTKWACVPEVDKPNEMMRTICNSFTNANCHDLPLEQLKSRIQESVKNKKYLLVLDDIWDESRHNWLVLKSLLECGSKGSKIIVTTRSDVVAKAVGTCPPHKLGLFSDEESWKLFESLAFRKGQRESDPSFTTIGKDIANRCARLPLAIRVIGSLLYTKDSVREWELFRDDFLPKMNTAEEEQIMPILKISYDFLPTPLKQCFAYCSIFPKDYEFDKTELVRLWMAQGYIESSKDGTSIKDLGDLYFMELLRRNFFQEAIEGYITNEIVWCKMHDLLHDLALHVAGDDEVLENKKINYMFLLDEQHGFSTRKMRSVVSSQHYRFDYPPWNPTKDMFLSCQFLRALKLMGLSTLPGCIGKLRHLRYLDLRFGSFHYLPDEIVELENLQTLNLDGCSSLKQLPRGFTNLVNLRNLGIQDCGELNDLPSGFGNMNLQELNYFIVRDNNGVDALTNLDLRGDLQLRFQRWRRNTMSEAKGVNMKGKKRLISLSLRFSFAEEEVMTPTPNDMELLLDCMISPPNLKSLGVRGYRGERFQRRMVEELPCLLPNIVHVVIMDCSRCQQLPRFSQLPHLKDLELRLLNAVEYIEDDSGSGGGVHPCYSATYFPSLEYLQLSHMDNLKGWWSRPRVKNDVQVATQPSHECLTAEQLPLRNTFDELQELPALKELEIRSCENLDLWADTRNWPNLKSLQTLTVENNSKLQEFPSSICSLKTLSHLRIWYLKNMKALPEEMGQLTQLRSLKICQCSKLDSLPQSLSGLSSLQKLEIEYCPLLVERCRPPNGEYWPLIQHIPYIKLHGKKI